jgi:RNA polymerase sigma factor (sigma-70 family)
MDQLSDAKVLQSSLAEPEVFGRIFDRHFDPIRRYLVRRLGVAIGDELAAEVFARAFDLRGRYDESRGEVRAWLFGIAANLIRRHRRDERRRLMALTRVPTDREASEEAEIDQRLDAGGQGQALVRGLLALSRHDRETLLLFVWGELSYLEVAQALELPIGTVRSRISRARSIVRRELDGGDGQEDVEPCIRGALLDGGKP